MPIDPWAAAVTASPNPRGPSPDAICRQNATDTRACRPSSDLLTDSVSQLAWSVSWPIANMPGWLPAKIVPVSRPSPLASALSVSRSLASSRSTPISALHRSRSRSTSIAPTPTGVLALNANTSAATSSPDPESPRWKKMKDRRITVLLTDRPRSAPTPAASAPRSTFHPPRCWLRSPRTSTAPDALLRLYQSSSRISWGRPLGSGRSGDMPPATSILIPRSSNVATGQ
jgi:hypothetical protein